MIPRAVKRRIRPMWLAALATAAWTNRHDLRRWINFAKQAVTERQSRSMGELVTEAKVRAAVSMDPVLRRDQSLKDLEVRDGVVKLYTDESNWPAARNRFARLSRVKGVTDVEATTGRPVATIEPLHVPA